MQLRSFVIAIVLLAGVHVASAQPEPPPSNKLVVATRPISPFIIKKPDGTWTGISIDLLKRIAEELKVTLDIRELTLEELFAGKPEYDITASLNVTEKSDGKWDLSHAFYSTGLAIAVPEHGKESRWDVVKRVFSGPFMWLLGGTVLLLLLVGLLMWRVERRPVKELPKDKELLSRSLFWATEPITRYKSKEHNTNAGRTIGMLWGLCGVIFISTLTANLSSQLTVHQLQSPIRSPDDLPQKRVGTVAKSAGLKYCERHGLRTTEYADAEAAMIALETGEIEAIVYEAPILQYLAATNHKQTRVLPGTFDNHGYAFGLKRDSPIRRELNKALLAVIVTDSWRSVMRSYLGRAE